jgi:integrase
MAKRKKRNGVEYREERDRWGYRLSHQGRIYKRYVWETREEAKAALTEFKQELASKLKEPELPPTALITVVSAYLVDSAEQGRSQWRLDAMRWNFNKVILPFFGTAAPIGSITTEQVRKMVRERKRQVKPKTLWHDVTNLRALFNWAMIPKGTDKKPLITANPVDGLDNPKGDLARLIGNTKPKKAPLNLAMVDRAAAVLDSANRAYFDFLRFTGLRKDEANRLRWEDINFDEGYFHCRGTKTDEADAYLPLAPALIESLKTHKVTNQSEYVFAGRSAQTRGKKIYSRRRLFEKIERLTAHCLDCSKASIGKRRYCQDCRQVETVSRIHRCSKCRSTKVDEGVGCVACGSSNIKPGVKFRPKDMRDYFASTVQTDDPRVLMSLMRHTNLTTTTKYLRAMHERMKEAVSGLGKTSSETSDKILGATLGASQNALRGQKTAQNSLQAKMAELARMLITQQNAYGKVGGGGQIRTVDAADMSRVL